jgi:ribosomal protein S5
VLESVGVKDVLTKSLGSKNAANVVKATMKAFAMSMRSARNDLSSCRGLEVAEVEKPKAAGHGDAVATA